MIVYHNSVFFQPILTYFEVKISFKSERKQVTPLVTIKLVTAFWRGAKSLIIAELGFGMFGTVIDDNSLN